MNLNDYVWVKLTPWGEEVLKKYTDKFPVGVYDGLSFEKRYGSTRFQMHELMKIFGPDSYVGAEVCFEENSISFEPPKIPLKPPPKPAYHVVLKRVYNVVFEKITGVETEEEAILAAEKKFEELERHVNGINVAQGVFLDDGDEAVSALVDTLDEDGNYEVESYYEADPNSDGYIKKR